jgi:hypothetical protein
MCRRSIRRFSLRQVQLIIPTCNSNSRIQSLRRRPQPTMSKPHHDSAILPIGRNEEHKKALKRMQEIMAQHDGGSDADPKKAVDTVGWENAW